MEENNKDEEVKKTSEETSKVEKTDEVEEVKEENKPEKKEEPKQEEVEKETKEQPKVEVKQDDRPEKKLKEENTFTKKKKNIKIIVFLLIFVLIIVAVIVYFKVFYRKTIDLADYIEVTYYTSSSSSSYYSYFYDDIDNPAYNGYATISISLNTDKLKELLGTEKKAERFVDKTALTIESENNGSLSNGDIVEVTIDISDSYLKDVKLKLKDYTLSITVEGLEDANILDLFDEDDFQIELTGISPEISMSVNNNSTNDFIKNNVTYSLSQSSGLANGDTVTITASYNSSTALSEGILIAVDTYEYTIEEMPEYIDSLEDLSTEVIDKLNSEFIDNVDAKIDDEKAFIIAYNYDNVSTGAEYTTTEPELVAMYLLTRKGTTNSWYAVNRVSAIYKVVYTITSTGETYDWYFVATAQEVSVQDGALYESDDITFSISGRWDDGETEEEAYDDLIDSYKSNYVIEIVE